MASQIIIVDLIQKGKDNLIYLSKKWFFIILFSLLSAVLGVVYTWLQDPKYTAEMRFVSESEQKGGLGNYASIAAQFGLDIGSAGNSSAFGGDNIIELFKTGILINKTLLSTYNSKLMIDWYITNHNINILSKTSHKLIKFGITQSNTVDRERDSIINMVTTKILKTQLEVDKIDKKLDIIYLKMIDKDEAFAIKFIEILANNTIGFYTQYKTHKNQLNVNILQHQVDSVKQMLFGDINQVASINDFNVNPLKQTMRISGQKKQIDLQVNSVLYTELLKNLELAKLSLRRETPLIQVIDTPHYPLKNEKKGRLFGAVVFGFLGGLITICFLLLARLVKMQESNI